MVQLITNFISMVTGTYFSMNRENLCVCVYFCIYAQGPVCMCVCIYMDT